MEEELLLWGCCSCSTGEYCAYINYYSTTYCPVIILRELTSESKTEPKGK